ncbi:excalibur calcium-binding domain-containing protein [Aquimarina pacifica]|uniref:excalibur calcium-binding domain-containing protein n=1 Tax=Aquimarina pacifica TaxID=1296415 RepID=UPI00046E96FB|nr:excalibur calcium-binding domain-containing protein [Aquimarina pacifica]
MKNKYNIILFITLVSFQNSCTSFDDVISNDPSCIDTNCSDYGSQQAAQAAFDADPDCHNDLDRDNDGIACEQNYYETNTSNCPTTANCGCSNKNKDVCIRDSCCQWIVGDGCRCK